MLRIKTLNRKNHPFTNKIKVYGMSLETILITSFLIVVVFVLLFSLNQNRNKKKENSRHDIITR
jgi:hypothetical protein